MLSTEEMVARFGYRTPSPEGIQAHAKLAQAFMTLGSVVDDACIDGREKSLVFTKLEEAKSWSFAAVARNPSTR
jgi:hypothetical protein